MGCTVRKVLRRLLRRDSEKGVSRRCLGRPLGEYGPLGVRPILDSSTICLFKVHSRQKMLHTFRRKIPLNNANRKAHWLKFREKQRNSRAWCM